LENRETSVCKKPSNADRRHSNRCPGKEITVIVERREERHAQAAVGHGVKEAMAGGRQEEVNPHGEPG